MLNEAGQKSEPRKLPLKIGQNQISNSGDNADKKLVYCGWW